MLYLPKHRLPGHYRYNSSITWIWRLSNAQIYESNTLALKTADDDITRFLGFIFSQLCWREINFLIKAKQALFGETCR
jgi:hypothetical protein